MKHDQQKDFVRIQSQLNYFKFSTEGGFGPLVSLLLQFVRQPAGGLRALVDGRTLLHLLSQSPEFWREAIRHYRAVRLYVYLRDVAEAPTMEMLAASPLAGVKAEVEVCCFVSSDLECCLFYTEEQLLALQDNNGQKVGFAFPREWSFINDYTRMIERFATLGAPVLHYSNREIRPPLPAHPPRN